jgi:ABC-type lipoprotein export system ATPase subunit
LLDELEASKQSRLRDWSVLQRLQPNIDNNLVFADRFTESFCSELSLEHTQSLGKMILDEIMQLSSGAEFRRADLHIHTFGEDGSYDVDDAGMTPEAIVDISIQENLQVIAITDHNAVGNVRRAVKHSNGKPLLVVPGVELSTPQGHFLVYCPNPYQLEGFYGKLDISPDRRTCSNTIAQCLKFAEEFDGFGVCPHIELSTGLEEACPKFDAFKQQILNCKNLLALEVSNATNSGWFSLSDENSDRKNCASLRCAHLGQEEGVELPKVMSSDAHSIGALGKNAAGNRRLTRIKMDSLTFDSLRIALLHGAARVRLEDLVPSQVPHFVGMKLEGGFLRDQAVHFSRNLTCIIGGRGAGKSTMLEALRVSSGNRVENSIVDSEVWPDAITLVYEDEVGLQHTLTRSKLNQVTNSDPNGPTSVMIESHGQGETAETIQHCDKDPAILLNFLDGFVDLNELRRKDEELREALLTNQTEIERLQLDLNRIPEIEAAKKVADQQVATLKTQKAGEVVELEQKLANGRRFRDQLTEKLNALLTSINSSLTGEDLKSLSAGMDGSTLAVGKTEFDTVNKLILDLATDVETLSAQLKSKVKDAAANINAQLKVWVTKEQETQTKIEDLRRELEKQKIKLDIAFIRKVTKDATDHATKLLELRKSIPKQQDAYKQRRKLVQARRELKSKMFTTRQAFATVINKNLVTTVVDYRVTVRYHEGLYSKELEELIKTAMGWRTSQVPKAQLIAESVSPFSLLDAVSKNDTSVLEQITDENTNRVFSKTEAQEVFTKLKEWAPHVAIQRCAFEDRPEIKVSRTIVNPDGTKSHPVRDFSKLSLGQQQSILLSILLFSKSKTPLIIDQPEDNLDSEFVYKTIVRALRSIKEHRQVIIVTHNANIAVLGDAELIVPLRGASDLAVIRDRGSIDTKETKEIVCTILEGSKKAFVRRRQIYGY